MNDMEKKRLSDTEQVIIGKDDIEENEDVEEFSYVKYMLFVKIPIRFIKILIPEILISVILYALVKTQLISSIYRPLHIIALLGFWILIWHSSVKNFCRTHEVSHYYICNITAYALFLLVAFGAFMLNYHSPLYPKDYVYWPCFRLSYVFSLLPTKTVDTSLLPLSMIVFYSVTFVEIMLVPLIPRIMHALHTLHELYDEM